MLKRFLLASVIVVAAGSLADAEVISITSMRDNTLFENITGDLSNGAGSGMFVGNTNQGGENRRRALVAFDIAGSVPAGSIITNVSLTVTCNQARGSGIVVGLHPVLANWGEGTSDSGPFGGSGDDSTPGDATWIHAFYAFPGGVLWATEGGDFNPAANATRNVSGEGPVTWASTDSMVSVVQRWLNRPDQNFGWMLKSSNETGSQNAKRFATREEPVVATRPRLTIEYTIPAPGGVALAGMFLVVAGRRRRVVGRVVVV